MDFYEKLQLERVDGSLHFITLRVSRYEEAFVGGYPLGSEALFKIVNPRRKSNFSAVRLYPKLARGLEALILLKGLRSFGVYRDEGGSIYIVKSLVVRDVETALRSLIEGGSNE